jgi:anti-anti-sigma regulatory factor
VTIFESSATLRIEKQSQRGKTTIRLIGHFQLEHVEELQKQLEQNGAQFVLDLTELTLVDIDIVRFLGTCEASGVELVNCSPYIREWMNQERKCKPVQST